jgi:hypothetical protein
MGWDEHEFRVEDLAIGDTQEFEVGRNYLKKLLTARRWQRGLNPVLKTMREMTYATGREFAMDLYTSLSKSSAQRYQIQGLHFLFLS